MVKWSLPSLLLLGCSENMLASLPVDPEAIEGQGEVIGELAAPVADAGADRAIETHTPTTLDGTGSFDPDEGSPLVFAWTPESIPPGSSATLDDTSSATPTFEPDEDGTYTFALTVQNTAGIWDATPDTVTLTASTPVIGEPVSFAGADQTAAAGDLITLDGSGSFDPAGLTPLTFEWLLMDKPLGSLVSVNDPTLVSWTFEADVAGTYLFELGVQNSAGVWDSTPDIVEITIDPAPVLPPVADAGLDRLVDTGASVTLNGTLSSDPAGLTPLVFQWGWVSRPTGSSAFLANTSTDQPTFTADMAGDFVFELAVQNSAGVWDPTPDTVVITAQDVVIDEPISDAGPDQTVPEDTLVTLDGSGSTDPGGLTPLTYQWTLSSRPPGSSAALSNAGAEAPTLFTDEAGTYLATLVVRNSQGVWDSTPDDVQVTAEAPIVLPPAADAGPDQSVDVGTTVYLDGSASSDPQGLTPLAYLWTWSSRPTGSLSALSSTTTAQPNFAPDVDGDYVFDLVVRNTSGVWDPTPDTVNITATAVVIDEPVAIAGPDLSLQTDNWVTLDGSASYDPGGHTPLVYTWTLPTRPPGSTAILSAASTETPSFYADLEGTYIVSLTVRNSAGVWDSTPDEVTVTAADPIIPEPVADAGPDQTVEEGEVVLLDGSASYDPAGNTPLVYDWDLDTVPSGSAAFLTTPSTVDPSFEADLAGVYRVSLAVRNSQGIWDTTPDSVIISAEVAVIDAPVADAGADAVIDPLTTHQLDGSASYDPGGYTPLTYSWSVLSHPQNSTVALSDATDQRPTFFADLAGNYAFELAVRNSAGIWDPTPDAVSVTANPPDGFYVEVSWDATNDLDVHLLDGSTGIFGAGDCNFCNMNPEWGQAGTADNPSLDWDAMFGFGPETITTDAPVNGSYDVQVHYFGLDGYSSCFGTCPSATARVKIYLGGVLARTYTRTLTDQGQVWHVARLDWPAGLVTTVDSMSSTTLTDCW